MNTASVLMMIYDKVRKDGSVKNAEWNSKSVSFEIDGRKYEVTVTSRD
jgi:hypothetical protein